MLSNLNFSSFLFISVSANTFETYVFDVSRHFVTVTDLRIGSIILSVNTNKTYQHKYAIVETETIDSLCVLNISFKEIPYESASLNFYTMEIEALTDSGQLLKCSDIIRTTDVNVI